MAKFGAFLSGLFFGGLAGAGIAVLLAPKTGRELRNELMHTSDNIYRKAAYELEELGDRVDDLKKRIEEQQQQLPTAARHDFSPPVEAAVDRAKNALENAQKTHARSQDVIRRTQA